MIPITTSKKSYDKYLFDINDYTIEKEIGGGNFGCVYIVQNNKNGERYATKTNFQKKVQFRHYISREVNILIRIRHETIIPFLGFSYTDFRKKENLTILMKYMEKGSLSSFIKERSLELTPTVKQIILIGIARGMMILHKFQVIHRDLKPDNVLLDSNLHPHITDFGISKFFDANKPTEQTQAEMGTYYYMAPEVIDGPNFDIRADVYSFGILMYEVVTGQKAFEYLEKLTPFHFCEKILQGSRPIIEKGTIKQKGLRVMMKKCWDRNPSNRPSFSEIFKKLSLSTNEYLLGFENNPEKEKIDIIIKDEHDDDEEIAKEVQKAEEMKKKKINTRFCLDGVDYDQVLQYVDDVLDEPKSMQDEEIEDLKKEIAELKETIQNQAALINQLQKKVPIDDDSKDLKDEIVELKTIITNQSKTIKKLQKDETSLTDFSEKTGEIENLKHDVLSLQERTKSQEILVKKLKKKTNSQESIISSLKSDLENKSESSQFQDILDSIMENVGQMNQEQQETIKKQQEKIDKQEAQLKKQKEKIEQQQQDIFNQLEVFKEQIKNLTEKLNKQKNSDAENDDDDDVVVDKEATISSIESDSDSAKLEKSVTNKYYDDDEDDDDDVADKRAIVSSIESDSDSARLEKSVTNKHDDDDDDKDEDEEDDDDDDKISDADLVESIYYNVVPHGIVNYLNDNVVITAGGNGNNVNCIRNIGGSGFNNWINYTPANENDSFIEFDFGDQFRVELNSYLIHPYKQPRVRIFPKSWKIVGSNDQSKWEIIDEREDEYSLKNNMEEHFYCKNLYNYRFKYIRFVQFDSWSPSGEKPYYVAISFLELFGDIYSVK